MFVGKASKHFSRRDKQTNFVAIGALRENWIIIGEERSSYMVSVKKYLPKLRKFDNRNKILILHPLILLLFICFV